MKLPPKPTPDLATLRAAYDAACRKAAALVDGDHEEWRAAYAAAAQAWIRLKGKAT